MTALAEIPKEWKTSHPVLRLPTREEVKGYVARGEAGLAALTDFLKRRYELIVKEREDPLRYGYEPDCWRTVRKLIDDGFEEIAIFGANREGKTDFLAKYVVEKMMERKLEVACFHNTESTSKAQQQSRVFSKLPPEWRLRARKNFRTDHRGVAREADEYLKFTPAGGFSNNLLITPGHVDPKTETKIEGSRCTFFNYGQSMDVWEGPEYDLMWFDEHLTLPILETSRYRRAPGRKLIILVTFTPKWGYTACFANLLAGARIVETRPASLLDPEQVHVRGCPKGHMPYVMHGRNPGMAIVFFHNQMNPMGAGREIAKALIGAPKVRIMIRGYGYAEKTAASAFPKFSDAHVITRKRFEEIRKGPGTYYVVTDPAGARNWFFTWWFCTPDNFKIICNEWPDKKRYEEWAKTPGEVDDDDESATARKNDWRPGPAMRLEAGRSIASYKSLLLVEEGWAFDPAAAKAVPPPPKLMGLWRGDENTITVEARIMDPRFAGTENPGAEEGKSVLELMEETDQKDSSGREVPPMEWEPGSGKRIEDRLQMLQDLMEWNEAEPRSPTNCPKLLVVEDCEQIIIAFREYVAPPNSTERNALKDPIDTAGYFVKSGYGYVQPAIAKGKQGGFW